MNKGRRAWLVSIGALALAGCVGPAPTRDTAPIANPAIDMAGHLSIAAAAAKHRESHRLSEGEFLRLTRAPATQRTG